MKVILTKTVKKLGSKGEEVSVKSGYGRNFLIPNGYAVSATSGARRDAKLHQARATKTGDELAKSASEVTKKLERKVVNITAKAAESEKLFGSVGPKEVADAVSELAGLKIPAANIILEEYITSLGEHTAQLKLAPENIIDLKIQITSEDTGK